MSGGTDVAALVLAGGHSRRMGRDKRRLRLWGADGLTLLAHTCAVVREVCPQLSVALNDPAAWSALHVPLLADRWPDCGPLGGIGAGLAATDQPWLLVVAADMPWVDAAVLRALLDQPRAGAALVPGWTDAAGLHREPLHALIQRNTLPALDAFVASGGRAVLGWLATIDTRWWDPTGCVPGWRRAFANLNTPADAAAFDGPR